MSNDLKFEYGYDVEVYIQKAVEILKNQYHYHWADSSLFNKQTSYAIEEENGEYHYIRYTTFSEDDIEREILDVAPNPPYKKVECAEDFIRFIASDNEYAVQYSNRKVANYKVRFEQGLMVDRWYIERYEFNRLQTGDYSAFVQAGDRTTGASRDFFIPPEFMTGTFEEFLDRYEGLVPGEDFGLYKKDLIKDEGLKAFLGFK